MFGSLAHCAHAVDKFIDLCTFILRWHFRKNLAHLYPAFFVFALKPFILFISANCQANFLTLLIISGKPAFETLQPLQQAWPHPLKNNIFLVCTCTFCLVIFWFTFDRFCLTEYLLTSRQHFWLPWPATVMPCPFDNVIHMLPYSQSWNTIFLSQMFHLWFAMCRC